MFALYMSSIQPKEIKNELGSYDNPQEAFEQTQKALALLSQNVNIGIESVKYVQEYENAKNRVFKNNN